MRKPSATDGVKWGTILTLLGSAIHLFLLPAGAREVNGFGEAALFQPQLASPIELAVASWEQDPWYATDQELRLVNHVLQEDPEADPPTPVPEEPLGQAPEDNSLAFLRTQTVLLEPGQWEFDYGLRYIWQQNSISALVALPAPPGAVGAVTRLRHRQFIVPVAIRYGWNERLQPFVNLPFGGAVAEAANPFFNDTSSVFGLGDVTAGLTYLIRERYGDCPDIVGTISCTAPTGDDPFQIDPSPVQNGGGFWGVSGRLTWIKAYDPAVIFAGVGYTHEFRRTFEIGEIIPGELFDYNLGIGFAINDRLTVSSTFIGAFQSRTLINGPLLIPDADTTREPFALRMALTYTCGKCRIIEPFVTFGLNEDAAEADFGITVTRRY